MLDKIISTSYKYVLKAEETNKKNKHENLGFLSFKRGFMPLQDPRKSLPISFAIWDQIAQNLPYHYKNQSLRETLKRMPVLEATEDKLKDAFLCRASMLMSMLAHAYVRCEREEDLNIPDSILIPWHQITNRLNRPKPFLSYIDLIIYNWKLRDEKEGFKVENLDLLVPTVNNQEEQVFYLTQAEISFKTRKTVKIITEIQNSILRDNVNKVIKGLKELQQIIEYITEDSFLKIDPNPRSKTYVDPIVWAKTVAPFAVPLKEGIQGPSGTSAPVFHLIDTFIERSKYDTILGEEALFIREWYPKHWREFINSVEEVSILNYIKEKKNEELEGAFYSFIESYSGNNGFLGVHRRKVYGYLQMAFKVGRSVTIGGFSGLFKERTWEEVDDELETTRLERYINKDLKCPFSSIVERRTIGEENIKNIKNVKLDVKNKGISFRPGDRCAIIPKNSKERVDEIIKLLGVKEETVVKLTDIWIQYFKDYYRKEVTKVSIRDFLLSAKLNDVNNLLTQCTHLAQLLDLNETVERITLVDVLQACKNNSLDVKKFVTPYLAEFLIPEGERMYSISSGFKENNLELIVGNAETTIEGKTYRGVASDYLHSATFDAKNNLPFKIVRPLRFTLPKDLNKPIYFFAGGTGIAPFKGFWEKLQEQKLEHNLRIFYSVKYLKDLVFKEELEKLLCKEGVSISIIVTRESLVLNEEKSISNGNFVFEESDLARINYELTKKNKSNLLYKALKPISEGGDSGYFFVCGKAGFAKAILEEIKDLIKRNSNQGGNEAKEIFYSLFAENRYMQDIFSSPQKIEKGTEYFNMSEVVKHNNDRYGYWVVVNNKVYDLTEFKEIHPGGVKIVLDNAGRDATHEFKRANHHQSGEIMSMLSMYYIGELKQVDFPNQDMKKKYKKWLNTLHLSSEMFNTLLMDFSFKEKKTTAIEEADEKTFYKLALLAENHNRFIEEYVKNIVEFFMSFYTNSKEIDKILILLNNLIHKKININEIKGKCNYEKFDDIWSHLILIENRDIEIMKAYRKLLWAGLKYFEMYEEELDNVFRISIKNILTIFISDLNKLKHNSIVLD